MSELNINALVRQAHETNNYDALIELIPYARLIGIECLRLGDDMVVRLRRPGQHRQSICRPSMAE